MKYHLQLKSHEIQSIRQIVDGSIKKAKETSLEEHCCVKYKENHNNKFPSRSLHSVGMMLTVPNEKELMRKSRNSGGGKKPAVVMMPHVLCKILVFCFSFLGAYMLGWDCYIQALKKHRPTTHYNRNTAFNAPWINLTEFT